MSEFFTQSELAERLVQKTGISLETAKKFSSCFFSIIKKGLKTNDRFSVYNFGTFKKTWIETSLGFNPSTGERIEIPAHWRIKFIPCPALAKRLNRPYEKLKPKVINEKVSDNGLLARASKIRSEDEAAHPSHSVPPVDENVKPQENDDFIDTDFDDDNDGNERTGLFKYIAIAAVSALFLIVLLVLLLKSCTSSPKKNGSGKEKGIQAANNAVVESKEEELSAEDEVKDNQSKETHTETSETEDGGENNGDVNESAEEKIPEESVETAEEDENAKNAEKTASEIAEEKSSKKPLKKDEYDEKAVSDLFEFYTVPSGLCYYSIAEKKFGNRHLWPLIYSANKSISVDPDLISVNARIKIPDLNGMSALDYAQTDSGREAIFAAALDSYNGYLLMIEKEPNSSKNDERRRRAIGAIVSGEVLCPGFIEAKKARIMPEYAQLAKNIVEHQYK